MISCSKVRILSIIAFYKKKVKKLKKLLLICYKAKMLICVTKAVSEKASMPKSDS